MTQPFILGQLIEQIENTRQREKGFYLQYTGLKDKNGVEICEGDIVKFRDVIFEAFWDGENFGFNFRSPIEQDSLEIKSLQDWVALTSREQFEIIGNIYENPELLEAINET